MLTSSCIHWQDRTSMIDRQGTPEGIDGKRGGNTAHECEQEQRRMIFFESFHFYSLFIDYYQYESRKKILRNFHG
jgi:hypothetical protein